MAKPFPKEPKINDDVLKKGNKPLRIYYGANAWGRTEWVGELYPTGTREKEFLAHYVDYFNAVELNATHYSEYTHEEIKNWANKAEGKEFLFCPKIPQRISHYSSFVDVEDQTKAFFESISALGEHTGPVIFQVSDRFSPKRKENLYEYLQTLPKSIQLFLEVRNPQWFEREEYENHLKFLKSMNLGSVISDGSDRILALGFSIPKCYIRYTPTDDLERVKQWFDKIKDWGNKGLTEAYFFVQPPQKKEDSALQLKALQYFKQLVTTT